MQRLQTLPLAHVQWLSNKFRKRLTETRVDVVQNEEYYCGHALRSAQREKQKDTPNHKTNQNV